MVDGKVTDCLIVSALILLMMQNYCHRLIPSGILYLLHNTTGVNLGVWAQQISIYFNQLLIYLLINASLVDDLSCHGVLFGNCILYTGDYGGWFISLLTDRQTISLGGALEVSFMMLNSWIVTMENRCAGKLHKHKHQAGSLLLYIYSWPSLAKR